MVMENNVPDARYCSWCVCVAT